MEREGCETWKVIFCVLHVYHSVLSFDPILIRTFSIRTGHTPVKHAGLPWDCPTIRKPWAVGTNPPGTVRSFRSMVFYHQHWWKHEVFYLHWTDNWNMCRYVPCVFSGRADFWLRNEHRRGSAERGETEVVQKERAGWRGEQGWLE